MVKKIYADNYRCLVNFELNFDCINLILGPNGAGKSSIFDILASIRELIIDNKRVGEVFSVDDLTSWMKKNTQTFELYVKGNDGEYRYKLVISFQQETNKQHIESETLSFNGKPIFEFKLGDVQLYHDDFTEGPKYNFDWTLSALSTITPRNDNKKLSWYKQWIEKLFILRLEPRSIDSVSIEETPFLLRNGSNFVSWYRNFSQEHQDKIFDMIQYLRDNIVGFDSFKLETAGKHRLLKVGFKNDNSKTIFLDFEKLSDGQKVLIVLYLLLIALRDSSVTLLLDEPENYVALAEIQPWLMELRDSCGSCIPQAILISHHPEMIDYLGNDNGIWIDREPLEPTRVKAINKDEAVKLSEIIARGWIE